MTLDRDVSTIGVSKYERAPLDFYPTPREVTEAILPYIPRETIWEPACGDGAIAKVLSESGFAVCTSDIKDYGYEKFGGELDFLGAREDTHTPFKHCIVTNPPYDLSREFVQKALDLECVTRAFFLLRHEWDAPAKSLPLVTHPSFKTKYVLRKRPRWIEGTKTAPRFPYAWYEWDKAHTGPPTMVYGI